MKLSLIFSDIEAGSGNNTDDFVDEKLLCSTIKSHFEESKKQPSDIILNGDTLDFMKCPYKGKYPRHITPTISMGKLRSIVKAHPLFFQTLRKWLDTSKTNRLIFVHGNHDYDLVFEEVQELIKDFIAKKSKEVRSRIIFAGWEFQDDQLFVEHGSQLDEYFRVDPEKFVFFPKRLKIKERVLQLPWGFNALYDYIIQVKEEYPLIERIHPKKNVIALMPVHLKRRLMLGTLIYTLKSFFYTQFRFWYDPILKFPTFDFIRYMRGYFKNEFEVKFLENAKIKLIKNSCKVFSVGHNHQGAIIRLTEEKFILNTSSWRDEYLLVEKANIASPKHKSYGYVRHTKNKIHEVELKIVPSNQKPITLKNMFRRYERKGQNAPLTPVVIAKEVAKEAINLINPNK